MITTKLEKDKTTIVVYQRLKKAELKFVVNYITETIGGPTKKMSKKEIRQIADEVTKSAWERVKKERGFSWLK